MDSGTPPWPPDASGPAIPQAAPDEPPPQKRPAWVPWLGGLAVAIVAFGAFFVAKSIAGGSSTPSAVASTGNANTNANRGNGNSGQAFQGRFPGANGEITAINGATLTLKDRQGRSVQVKTTSSTTVTIEKTVGVDAIKTGDRITVAGDASGSAIAATRITVTDLQINGRGGGQGGPPPEGGQRRNFGGQNGSGQAPSGFVAGTVTKVDGGTITIKSFDGSTKTVTTSSTTTVMKGEQGSLTDLKVAQFVRATGDKDSAGNVTATAINEGAGGFGTFRGQGAP
jgi:hypothetical protein